MYFQFNWIKETLQLIVQLLLNSIKGIYETIPANQIRMADLQECPI